jgi:FkbH-like protein
MQIKLVIWDLDDTLWQGTLAEGDDVCLIEQRAEFVRAYNRCGLISAISSKNDPATARKKLELLKLWDEFVFTRIDFVPKGAAVKQMIEDMQLRPVNVLFVDDNAHNLHEVKSVVPEINIVDARSPECDILLQQILDDNKHISKSRVEEYRILQARVDDRQSQSVSNEAFLRSCNIRISFSMALENLEFKERIVELVNRSNQLNYTKSRIDLDTLNAMMFDITLYDCYSVFVWDKYGYYGLVGCAIIDRRSKAILHFVFSCRAMHMGVENVTLQKISARYPSPDISQFKIPLPTLNGDWFTEDKFLDADIRAMIRHKENTAHKKDVQIKIMYGCMSGGIAYYSRYRDMMDFDGAFFEQHKRFLSFSTLLTYPAEVSKQHFPRALVYGAAFDYYNAGWTPDALPLENDSFINGIYAFCKYFENGNHKLLVVLPPENMPDACYRPLDGNTRARTVAFNNVWRTLAPFFPFIACLDLTEFATPEDLADSAHYYAGFLQKIAQRIDAWYESIEMPAPYSIQTVELISCE